MSGPLGFPRPFAGPDGWREPNSKEKELLINWQKNTFNMSIEEAETAIDSRLADNRIIVKDKYVQDVPGYVGPIIIMLGGGPSLYLVFGIDQQTNELIEFEQEQ